MSLTLQTLSGPLPRMKGLCRTFPMPGRVEVFPHEQRTVFYDYPDRDHVGVFERGAVRLDAAADRRVVAESTHHRDTFRGLAKMRRWSPLDALYFFGYAL